MCDAAERHQRPNAAIVARRHGVSTSRVQRKYGYIVTIASRTIPRTLLGWNYAARAHRTCGAHVGHSPAMLVFADLHSGPSSRARTRRATIVVRRHHDGTPPYFRNVIRQYDAPPSAGAVISRPHLHFACATRFLPVLSARDPLQPTTSSTFVQVSRHGCRQPTLVPCVVNEPRVVRPRKKQARLHV